jgi:hypothetical protein
MRLLLAAMHSFAAQGRIGGIEQLTLKMGRKMKARGFVGQPRFKTAAKFGLQPVILDGLAKPLFSFYMDTLRPIMIGGRDGLTEDSSPLWLSYPFRAPVGRKLSLKLNEMLPTFFREHLGVELTSISIRKVYETTANYLELHRFITKQQRKSIAKISGHCMETANELYVIKERKRNVEDSRLVFSVYNDIILRGN